MDRRRSYHETAETDRQFIQGEYSSIFAVLCVPDAAPERAKRKPIPDADPFPQKSALPKGLQVPSFEKRPTYSDEPAWPPTAWHLSAFAGHRFDQFLLPVSPSPVQTPEARLTVPIAAPSLIE